jgi:hypothetical protein
MDGVEDTVQVIGHLRVPEPQNPKAFLLQPMLTLGVPDCDLAAGMRAAVEFNGESRCQAGEIDDIRTDRDLPAEMRALHGHACQRPPEDLLRLRRAGAQAPRGPPAEAREPSVSSVAHDR